MDNEHKPRKTRRFAFLVIGFLLGIATAFLAPRYLGPYLPLGGSEPTVIEGTVSDIKRGPEQVQFRLSSDRGLHQNVHGRPVAHGGGPGEAEILPGTGVIPLRFGNAASLGTEGDRIRGVVAAAEGDGDEQRG